MRAFSRLRRSRGFTLVELMIVVAIIGILAALAIYGVRRYMASAKTGEAKNMIGGIARSAVEAYEKETINNELLPDAQSSQTTMNVLCKTATAVPLAPPPGKKYQPNTTDGQDFNSGDNVTGWKCLKFQISQPIYYSYNYVTGQGTGLSGAGVNGFEATAIGDLDNNGVFSTFARGADVRNGQVVLSTQVFAKNEFE